ncbi:MAG: FMN-binding protein [Bacteroidota bacterium]
MRQRAARVSAGVIVAVIAHLHAIQGEELVPEAVRRALPEAETFEQRSIVLTGEQASEFQQKTGALPPRSPYVLYIGMRGVRAAGFAVVDNVKGKDQLITYVVTTGTDLRIRAVDIIAYREAYGGEVRNASWREQFLGKSPGDPLRPGREIRIISGATISSRAVTLGVKRVLALLETLKEALPQ